MKDRHSQILQVLCSILKSGNPAINPFDVPTCLDLAEEYINLLKKKETERIERLDAERRKYIEDTCPINRSGQTREK